MINKNKEMNGSIKISNNILNVIASTSALNINGVKGLVGPLGEKIVDPKKGAEKSTIVELGRDYVIVKVRIIADAQSKIPELSKKIQKKIKENIENFTGLNVTQVNIDIEEVFYN